MLAASLPMMACDLTWPAPCAAAETRFPLISTFLRHDIRPVTACLAVCVAGPFHLLDIRGDAAGLQHQGFTGPALPVLQVVHGGASTIDSDKNNAKVLILE